MRMPGLRAKLLYATALTLAVIIAIASWAWWRQCQLASQFLPRYELQLAHLRQYAERFDEFRGKSGFVTSDGAHVDISDMLFNGPIRESEVLEASISSREVGIAYHPEGLRMEGWHSWLTVSIPTDGYVVYKGTAEVTSDGRESKMPVVIITGKVRDSVDNLVVYGLIVPEVVSVRP